MLVSSKNNLNYIANIVDLLCYRQENQANEIAFTFLSNGETGQVDLTYQELDIKARSIAMMLQSQGAIGERSLLLYQPGLEFITAFFGCLYAGVIAVPAYPPRRNHHNHRLQAIVADAQATIILTTKSVISNIEKTLKEELPGTKLNYITTDDINISLANDWQSPQLNRDTLAFLQYTSGSTGMPKGVMVSHCNLLHNLGLIHQSFEHEPKSKGVIWLPPYHDMGLIGGVLQPIYGGVPVTLMPPVAFLQKPIRWLQAISDFKATTSGGPNFAYELCVQKIKPEQIAGLDLSSWKVAFTGAEPIRVQTLERFAKTFADCGFRMEAFYPCYGMAETTLFVSGGLTSESPIVRLVDGTKLSQNRVVDAVEDSANAQAITSCGCNWLDQKIVIAHPETKTTCAGGEVGEIWVSGESVALGYWRKPEQTQQTFHAYLMDTGEGPFLRTGDLGFLQDGELYVTGRIKDVIIIRGRNYYPQDIELTVENSHPALHSSSCAAFSIEVKDQEQLVIAVEVERAYLRNLDVDGIASSIRKAVSEQHELQVYAVAFLKPSSIPKTSSGKIQRHACRSGFLEDSLNTVGLWKSEVIESVKSQTKMQPTESKHIHPSTTSIKNSSRNSVNIKDKSKARADELAVSDTNALTTQISNYVTSIGDMEQTLAGEDNELDELLRRNISKNKSESESRVSLEFAENQDLLKLVEDNQAHSIEDNDNYNTEYIQSWIENWLAQKLKINVMSIIPTNSFSDYGMDSVMAVEAAQDLSEWLQHSLEPTILWNYPTIASLAQYLAKEVRVKTAETPKATELQIKLEQNTSSPLFDSLENEIEKSIAQELEVLENLLRG